MIMKYIFFSVDVTDDEVKEHFEIHLSILETHVGSNPVCGWRIIYWYVDFFV